MHGRTRDARYRQDADWDAVGEVVAAVPVPVVGNGDILFPQDIAAARARSGCAGVMVGRGALIKPWIFREAESGYWDITADERLAVYRRYVALAREHWGDDDHGTTRVREFLRWHLGFWCRYAPQRSRWHVSDDAESERHELRAVSARRPAGARRRCGAGLAGGQAHREEAVNPDGAPPPSETIVRELEVSEG